MLIGDATKRTGLTKKAIEYYTEQGLISPAVLENGYRDFSGSDVERLNKISVLRWLGIGIEEIRPVLADETGNALRKLSVQKELSVRREADKKSLLDRLSGGSSYPDIAGELKMLEQSATITERLLEAFPGYYGRFVCLHFARFLNEPIKTDAQQTAYQEITRFLDGAPPLEFPKELHEYLIEATRHISTQNITDMLDAVSETYRNPEKFFAENDETIKDYWAFKQSEEYKASPISKIQALQAQWNGTSGYYDVFIPAMKRLSTSYASYYTQMEAANEKLLSRYPDIAPRA